MENWLSVLRADPDAWSGSARARMNHLLNRFVLAFGDRAELGLALTSER